MRKLKLKETALANAAGVIGAAYYLGCYALALVSPELYKSIAQTWFHMLDLGSAWKSGPEGLVLGVISFTAVSWISGWLLAWTYNRFVSK